MKWNSRNWKNVIVEISAWVKQTIFTYEETWRNSGAYTDRRERRFNTHLKSRNVRIEKTLGIIVQWNNDCKLSEVMKDVISQTLRALCILRKTPCVKLKITKDFLLCICSPSYYKSISCWTNDLNMKSKTLKPLQASIGDYLYDFMVGNDSLNKVQKI